MINLERQNKNLYMVPEATSIVYEVIKSSDL